MLHALYSTRPNSMVERGILENRYALRSTCPDFILHICVANGIRIIEGSRRAVVRKDPQYSASEAAQETGEVGP